MEDENINMNESLQWLILIKSHTFDNITVAFFGLWFNIAGVRVFDAIVERVSWISLR